MQVLIQAAGQRVRKLLHGTTPADAQSATPAINETIVTAT
jgi:hypothetical protein